MNPVGTGTRVLSFIVDTLLILPLTYAAYRGWSFYVFYYGILYIPFYYFWAAVTFLYYLFFEGIFSRTPGKWMSLTKVVNVSGARPSFVQVLIRCVGRVMGIIIIDSILLPFLNQTLHDYISKTYIVEI